MSFSIPWENTPHKVRGEIILSCSKITEKGDEIEVEVYSEVDMKLSVSPKITKNQAVNEIKKYVEKCEKYIKENFKKSLIWFIKRNYCNLWKKIIRIIIIIKL